jgi:mono/diheme cytochrome c family protein
MSAPHDPSQPLSLQTPAESADQIDVNALHTSSEIEAREKLCGRDWMPFWVTGVSCAVFAWAGIYFGMFSGGFFGGGYDDSLSAGAGKAGAAAVAEDPPEVKFLKAGRRVYTANCQACHMATGTGAPGQFPPLAGSEWVSASPARVSSILLHGIQGPITVKGGTYNGVMPAWGGNLSDKEIAAVLTYVRQEWGNAAPPITEEEVAARRSATAGHSQPYTEAELQAIP